MSTQSRVLHAVCLLSTALAVAVYEEESNGLVTESASRIEETLADDRTRERGAEVADVNVSRKWQSSRALMRSEDISPDAPSSEQGSQKHESAYNQSSFAVDASGVAEEKCEKKTGGFCNFAKCDESRSAKCEEGYCVCNPPWCAKDGKCIPPPTPAPTMAPACEREHLWVPKRRDHHNDDKMCYDGDRLFEKDVPKFVTVDVQTVWLPEYHKCYDAMMKNPEAIELFFYGDKCIGCKAFTDKRPADTEKAYAVKLTAKLKTDFGKAGNKCAANDQIAEIKGAGATMDNCSLRCLKTCTCIAMSGVWGEWCSLCRKPLSEKSEGSTAYKREKEFDDLSASNNVAPQEEAGAVEQTSGPSETVLDCADDSRVCSPCPGDPNQICVKNQNKYTCHPRCDILLGEVQAKRADGSDCIPGSQRKLACHLAQCDATGNGCGLSGDAKKNMLPIVEMGTDYDVTLAAWLYEVRRNREYNFAKGWSAGMSETSAVCEQAGEAWTPCSVDNNGVNDGMCVGLFSGSRRCWGFINMEQKVDDFIYCQANYWSAKSMKLVHCSTVKIMLGVGATLFCLLIAGIVYGYIVFMRPKPLPREWKAVRVNKDMVYYWNRWTGETTWVRPA